MTVRWKPLLAISGLFLVIGIMGLLAMVYALAPNNAPELLAKARKARAAHRYDEAKIHYLRVLQTEGKDGKIHQELGEMYTEWSETLTDPKKAEIAMQATASFAEAARRGKNLVKPRRALLAEALASAREQEVARWAGELYALEPTDLDANYVLAAKELDEKTPKTSVVKNQLAVLDADLKHPLRAALVRAKLGRATGDDAEVEKALAATRAIEPAPATDPIDLMALMRLRYLDAAVAPDSAEFPNRVRAAAKIASGLIGDTRLAAYSQQISAMLENLQKRILARKSRPGEAGAQGVRELAAELDGVIEKLFEKVLKGPASGDLAMRQRYADHLLFRERYEPCVRQVEEALQLPAANAPGFKDSALALQSIAIRATLANSKDADRFRRAEPHIKALISSKTTFFEAMGNLFQGAIDLERMGTAEGADGGSVSPERKSVYRARALAELAIAAEKLKQDATAQALYGIALCLSDEPNLGRQHLLAAERLGNLDERYRVWPAWSLLQAGYPEEAEPMVMKLLAEAGESDETQELRGTLHLLLGEILQAKQGEADLRRARAEFDLAVKMGRPITPALRMRQAQVEMLLGDERRAQAFLRELGGADPSAAAMTVRLLMEDAKYKEAAAILQQARGNHAENSDLACLDAVLHCRMGEPGQADKLLEGYLAKHPADSVALQTRVQVLAESLQKPREARDLLAGFADKSTTSSALIQLALLDLQLQDFKAMAKTIARLRERYKELAAADLLEAQLALAERNYAAAAKAFDSALAKDPKNKIALFWRAQLDSRTGSVGQAVETLETIASSKTSKLLEPNLPLTAAADSALAAIEMESGRIDQAIQRIRSLLAVTSLGPNARPLRWQLVAAYHAKKQWTLGKQELAKLLDNRNEPPAIDERIRGAAFLAANGEFDSADRQIDQAFKQDPTSAGAALARARVLSERKKPDQARDFLSGFIAKAKAPEADLYLMLAAVESLADPGPAGNDKALAALERGLAAHADSVSLVEARYRLVRETDPARAVATIEQAYRQARKSLVLRSFLVQVYREEKRPADAEKLLRETIRETPNDPTPAALLIRVISDQAIAAVDRGDSDKAHILNEACAKEVEANRKKFPDDSVFLQAECELAARLGEITKALGITEKIDQMDKASPIGPLMRATIYSAQGRMRETADAYIEAIRRDPRRDDIRLLLGRLYLQLGEFEESTQQADSILNHQPGQIDAALLKSMTLSVARGDAARTAQNRLEAIAMLRDLIEKHPKRIDIRRRLADTLLLAGRRDEAAATLKRALALAPTDAAAVEMLVQVLASPRAGKPATAAEVKSAEAVAETNARGEKSGRIALAVSLGYQKAGRLELALPWAEVAAERLKDPMAELNLANIYLSIGEENPEDSRSGELFKKAVARYDIVLKSQANAIEAVNNKAWILHRYFGENEQALVLAKGLTSRIDPSLLPAEFFDTMGSIQESLGKSSEAAATYSRGLERNPGLPMLNYHLGRLLAANPRTESQAGAYLKKALEKPGALPKTAGAEIKRLLEMKAN